MAWAQRAGTSPRQAFVCNSGSAASAAQFKVRLFGPPATVTVWLHWLTLPHASVADQVRVTESGQRLFVTVLTTAIVTPGPAALAQLSVAVGGLKFHCVPQGTVLFGAQVMVGGMRS